MSFSPSLKLDKGHMQGFDHVLLTYLSTKIFNFFLSILCSTFSKKDLISEGDSAN